MNKKLPLYYINKKNTVIQIVFTTLFAYAFINLYKPFGSREWYDVPFGLFSLGSGILVISGMLVVLISRLFLFWIKRFRQISVFYYILMIAAEIIFMAIIYVIFERLILKDLRHFLILLYTAIQNTALILLIPYIITILYYEWQEKKMSFDKLIKQISQRSHFISFKDEKGIIRFTLKTNDLIFLESYDNYVLIHYKSEAKTKTYLIRNSLKNFEQQLSDAPIIRCHRSYSVNVNHVKLLKQERKNVNIIMDTLEQNIIPVSKSYSEKVIKTLSESNVTF